MINVITSSSKQQHAIQDVCGNTSEQVDVIIL